MKLFIPAIGTKIKLTMPWTFTLNREYRNESLYRFHCMSVGDTPEENWAWDWNSSKTGAIQFTMPSGITLIIDRIYIKKPSPQYNSVTFRIPKKYGNPPRIEGCRFWVKLNDANNVEGDIVV